MPETRNAERFGRASLRARKKENMVSNPEMLARALLRAREKENMASYFPTVKGAEIRSPLPAHALTDITECLQILQITRTRQPMPMAKVRQPMIHDTLSQKIHGIPSLQEMEVALPTPLFIPQETEATMANPTVGMQQLQEEQSGRGRGGTHFQPKKKSSLKPLMKMR